MSYVKHHQYEKRQELFDNVNPLMTKYKYDGEFPPTYVPMEKRKSIAHYMGRSSFATGYHGKLITNTSSTDIKNLDVGIYLF